MPTETPISDFDVANAMTRYGGSFARALANAAHHADPENLELIKATWPQLWLEYAELVRLSREREATA